MNVLQAEPDNVAATVAHETVPDGSTPAVAASVIGCIAAVALLLFGAVNVARAGFDGAWRDPIVQVAGYQGTVVLGLIAVGAGIALIGAVSSRDRDAILFVSIVLAVAGATLAIEPTVGGDVVAAEADFGVTVLIVATLVAVAALAPGVRRTVNRLQGM